MEIDTISVKKEGVEREAILLKCIADEIHTLLGKALGSFSEKALKVSGVGDAAHLGRAIGEAHKSFLTNLYSPNVEKIASWNKSPETYLPLLGKNCYMYISNRVDGVADTLKRKPLNALVIAPKDVNEHDPLNNPKPAVKEGDAGYVSMTYEQLVNWAPKLNRELIANVVLSGGSDLSKEPVDFHSHYFSMVAGCAEASRHLEFAVFALMVVALQKTTPEIWTTIIDAPPEGRAWPPMAKDAVGTMTVLKEREAIKGNEPVVVYFSRLVRLFAGNKHDTPINEGQAEVLQSHLKELVNKYIESLLFTKGRRLFLGSLVVMNKNRKPGAIAIYDQKPAEWLLNVSDEAYDKRVEDAYKEFMASV